MTIWQHRPCAPPPEAQERHSALVSALRERTAISASREQKQCARRAAKRQALSSSEFEVQFCLKPSTESVDEQWARALAKKGLPMDLVDDVEFRQAVLAPARAGLSYVDNSNPSHSDVKLPHRTRMVGSVMPALDKKLDLQVGNKIKGLLEQTGAMIISDGWTSVQSRPIVNALLSTPAGSRFLQAIDTSGDVKDAKYIAEFICQNIAEVGSDKIVAVCMDGACSSSFPLIEQQYPHVFCFICPTHSIDNFLKNVCSDRDVIRVRSVTTANDEKEFEWGESLFWGVGDDYSGT